MNILRFHILSSYRFINDSSKNEERVRRSIDVNRGIREIVKLVEQRYICLSSSTTSTKFIEMLQVVVQKKMNILKESLKIGGQSHSIW